MGELQIVPDAVPAVQAEAGELTVGELKKRLEIIHQAMADVMTSGIDYGKIPGTNKPTLMKPGAEKLCVLFQFGGKPSSIIKTYDGNHLTVDVEYELFHIPTGRAIGTGVGSCSTKESKYAYRKANRECPRCHSEAVFKSKNEPGYYCWAKKDGCGAKFQSPEDIALIESQQTGRKDNTDLADQYNTILKMAKKRAKIDATLDATGASAIFTQDVEDFRRERVEPEPPSGEWIAPGGWMPDDAKAEDSMPPPTRDPKAKTTTEERAAFIAMVRKAIPDKAASDKWLKEAFEERALPNWGAVTVGIMLSMQQQLEGDINVDKFINEGRTDTPDPADSFKLQGE
jgi:hypothetical protein